MLHCTDMTGFVSMHSVLQNGQWVEGRILEGAALDYKEVYQQMMTQKNGKINISKTVLTHAVFIVK